MPERIQRQRTKGWKAPAGAVYVGRQTRWGNPYVVGQWVHLSYDRLPVRAESRAHAVALFRAVITESDDSDIFCANIRRHLRGKDLMCWCPLVDANGAPVPCHADVLLEIANA